MITTDDVAALQEACEALKAEKATLIAHVSFLTDALHEWRTVCPLRIELDGSGLVRAAGRSGDQVNVNGTLVPSVNVANLDRYARRGGRR